MKKLFTLFLLLLLCCVCRAQLGYNELKVGTYYFFSHVARGSLFNWDQNKTDVKQSGNIAVLEAAGENSDGKQLYYIKRVDDDKYVAKRTGEYVALCDDSENAEPFYLGQRPGYSNHVRFYCTSSGNTGYWLATNGGQLNQAHYQNSGDAEHSGWFVTEAPRWKELTESLATAEQYTFGSALGQYTGTNTEIFTSAVTDAQTLTLPNATVGGVDELITKLDTSKYSLSLNMPEPKSFLRVKSTIVSGAYVSADNNDGGTSMLLSTDISKNNLLYYQPIGDKNYFLVCSSGRYVNNYNHAYNGYKANMIISEGSQPGTYHVKPYTANYWKSPETTGNISNSVSGTETECDWELEEVGAFPITMNQNTLGSNPDNKYYASLYMPKAVTLPEGVKAYTATSTNSTQLTLSLVASGDDEESNVLSAETPVVLCSEDNVTELSFANTDGVSTDQKVLRGSLQAEIVKNVTSGDTYVLGGANGVGFYKYNGWETPPFKAYLTAESLSAGSAGSNSFSFVFEGDDLTAISEAVKRADAESNVIYDLNGNIVNTPQKGHIYIRNNKTVKF